MNIRREYVSRLRWVGIALMVVGVLITFLLPSFFQFTSSSLSEFQLLSGTLYFVGHISSLCLVPLGAALIGASLVLQGIRGAVGAGPADAANPVATNSVPAGEPRSQGPSEIDDLFR